MFSSIALKASKDVFFARLRFCAEIVTDDVVPAFANVTLVSKDKCRRGTLHRTLCSCDTETADCFPVSGNES